MSYRVTILPAGETYGTQKGKSLLEAAIEQDLMLPHACKSGCCGACKARLVNGKISETNTQAALNSKDHNQQDFLLCCQSADSDITLYLPNYQGRNSHPAQILTARIEDIRYCANIAIVSLKLAQKKYFHFIAGQYIDIIMPNNLRRSYSIAAFNADTRQLVIHVRYHNGGAFSEQLFDGRLQPKDIIRVHGPLGSFQLNWLSKPLIMLASGTGIAPIEAMLAALVQQQYQQPVYVYWGMATEGDLYDRDLLDKLCASLARAQWTAVLSRAAITWKGAQGYVQDIALSKHPDMSNYAVYACGHPQMITHARNLFTSQASLAEDAFFADNFTPAA
jgi:CDP-4-dehydro-6-deoxyglucose reductase, E3